MKLHGRFHGIASAAMLLGACASSSPDQVEVEIDDRPQRAESLEDLAARTALPGEEDRYLVEGDLVLSHDGLTSYYEKRSHSDKAIVTTVVNNATGATFDAIRPNAMNLRYCLTSGWGGSQAVEANVEATLVQAARAWEGVARVRFTHVAASDGAGCTQSIVGTTVDFVVKPNVGSLNSSYAWWNFAQVSELAVGGNLGNNVSIMTHELGHVLGLDHEQFHDNAGLGCTPPTYTPPAGNFSWGNQRELTPYDNQSIMHYYSGGVPACGGGDDGRRVSVRDGIGMRALYGNPHWWAAVLLRS